MTDGFEPTEATVDGVHAAYEAGELTCRELVGKPYDEATVLSLAHAFDRLADPRVPPETTPPLEEWRAASPDLSQVNLK